MEETPAEYLTRWKRRHRLTDREAGKVVCLSASAFRRQRIGYVQHAAQTVRLAQLYTIYGVAWLDVAEAALKVGRMLNSSPQISRPSDAR